MEDVSSENCAKVRLQDSVMTKEDWKKFDDELRKNLTTGKMAVEVSQERMREHYDHLSGCVVKAAEMIIPHKKKQYYNGREMSEKTQRLHSLRTHDFNSGHKITKQYRVTWNKVIKESCRQDYEDWVTGQVKDVECVDAQGDTKKIASLVKRLTGETRGDQGKQSTRNKNGDLIT